MTEHCSSVRPTYAACLCSAHEKSSYGSPVMDLHSGVACTTGHRMGPDCHCKVCGQGLVLVTVDLYWRIVTSEALVNHKTGQNPLHPPQNTSTQVFWWHKLKDQILQSALLQQSKEAPSPNRAWFFFFAPVMASVTSHCQRGVCGDSKFFLWHPLHVKGWATHRTWPQGRITSHGTWNQFATFSGWKIPVQ